MKRPSSYRRARVASALALLALFFVSSVDVCLAIDNSICGLWRTVISRPGGDITVDWKIEPSGSYTVTSNGPGGKQSETGRITTEGNRYSKSTNIGPDNGTFQVMGNQRFSTTGRFGYTEWTRVGGGGGIGQAAGQIDKAIKKYLPPAYGGGGNKGSGYGSGSHGAFSPYQNDPPVAQSNGYNPEMNPRSAAWAKVGFGQAGTTKDQSGWTQGSNKPVASLQGADLKSLLFSNFPVNGADEVEQFGLPALGKAAAGGMRKRDFRMIQ